MHKQLCFDLLFLEKRMAFNRDCFPHLELSGTSKNETLPEFWYILECLIYLRYGCFLHWKVFTLLPLLRLIYLSIYHLLNKK